MTTQAISKKGWLAAALEATPLTLATEAKALFVPCKAVMTGTQHYEYVDEERNTVDTPNDRQPTTREGKTDPKGSFYVDTTPLFLFGLTGIPTSSQPNSGTDPTVWKHVFNLSDIPPTLSMWKSYHQVSYYATGVAVEKVVLKWSSAKLLECDVTAKHVWPTKYTTGTLTPTYSTVKPFQGYLPTITTSAGASSDIDEMTITLERMCKPWYPSAGVPDLTRWDYGARKASIEFQARFDTDTLYNLFRASTDDSLTVLFQGATISNAYKQELSLTFGTVGYDSMEHDTGKDNVMIKAKGTVRPTAGVMFSGWVQNTKTATQYAAS